ncbi:hypothetical protein ACLMJK_007424 [Lecanora helva]
MGKADADRDYYGDLGVDATADANEIKRAFKKLALIYHPDRNPGKEVEYNSKFQAIQSANEVLTDPQQRAKYDAQRIRSGHLHTYTNTSPPPSRTSASARTPAPGSSNFPPPPRPPPPQPKSHFPTSQSGAQKYANVRTSRAETSNPWTTSDDTKAKTNDYKAWEQMRARHGRGPIPTERTAPPKPPRASTFQPGREPTSATPAGTMPGRSGWDRFRESQADTPGFSRSNTTRASPNRAKFAPRTPGGDEPQAQGSAYFKVSRDERAANARSQMPPPPSPAPTAKKPDPLYTFKEQVGLNEPFGKKGSRTATQNQRGKADVVDATGVPGPGLHRAATSATPREGSSRTAFYQNESASAAASHMRTASAHSNHHSTSPPGKNPTKLPGMYSSSSSSGSSSGDERSTKPAKVFVAPPNSRKPHVAAGEQPRRGFNLYANVGDERMANVGPGGYSGIRRHSAVDLNTDKPSEGFQEHRMKHETEKSQRQSPDPHDAVRSPASNGSQPSLARSQSWQEKYRREHQDRWASTPAEKEAHSTEGGQATNTPMYGSPGYNPFSYPHSRENPHHGTPGSDKWSDQWPFMSPKRPRAATAKPPPLWAIPSSLPPLQKSHSHRRTESNAPSPFGVQDFSFANNDPFSSFNIPQYTKGGSAAPPPLRSHSSDNIDTKFSPDGCWHDKFFETPASRTTTPLRTVSPTEHSSAQRQPPPATEGPSATSNEPVPPPPRAHDKYNEEHWAPHLNDLNFDVLHSPQTNSPVRQGLRKRMKARGPKMAAAQPFVRDLDEEPTAANVTSATSESHEHNRTTNDFDAMDIDQPTPPKDNVANQTNGDFVPSKQSNGSAKPPRRVPTLPPRKNGYTQGHADTQKLDLGDLKSVFPLAPSNEGLGNMSDIATNLPFESRPSPAKPDTEESSQKLDLPNPPVCPRAPKSLTANSCDRFCRQVQSYMEEWNNFTVKMASLLAERRTFTRDNSGFTLLDIEDHGYDEYMRSLDKSRRTRVHFEVAAENHYQTMQNLGGWRQEMKRGRGGVPL